MSSKCKQCGEQIVKTGNYSFKIIPAKRIPKKAQKLMKATKPGESSDFGQSSFQKFLLKRSQPENFLVCYTTAQELSCGKCGSLTRIKMHKTCKREISNSSYKVRTSETHDDPKGNQGSAKKRKRESNSTELCSTTTAHNQKSKSGPSVLLGANKSRKKSAFQQRKQLENLKKVLFESKKAKTSGSSLQDFLSNI